MFKILIPDPWSLRSRHPIQDFEDKTLVAQESIKEPWCCKQKVASQHITHSREESDCGALPSRSCFTLNFGLRACLVFQKLESQHATRFDVGCEAAAYPIGSQGLQQNFQDNLVFSTAPIWSMRVLPPGQLYTRYCMPGFATAIFAAALTEPSKSVIEPWMYRTTGFSLVSLANSRSVIHAPSAAREPLSMTSWTLCNYIRKLPCHVQSVSCSRLSSLQHFTLNISQSVCFVVGVVIIASPSIFRSIAFVPVTSEVMWAWAMLSELCKLYRGTDTWPEPPVPHDFAHHWY